MLIEAVKNFIKENSLTGKTILVGFSGGIDSSCLLDILSNIDDIKVIAIHLNHNWRGDESKRDEDFARNFAKKRGIEFYSEILDEGVKKSETAAREERYKFFEKAKEKFKGDAVFLAHNKNDNAETLIYRLIKGTGPNGLNSIPVIRDFYYRPLIDYNRDEIERYIKENNVEFISDSSNLNTKYRRNLIREEIIPKMKEINPNILNSISALIRLNKMSQEIVQEAVLKAEDLIKDGNFYNREKFLSLSEPLKYEIVNRLLKNKLKTRDFKSIKEAVLFIENNASSKLSVNKELFLKVYNNKFYLIDNKKIKKHPEIILTEGVNFYNGYKFTVEKSFPPKKFPKKEDFIQYVNLDFENKYIIRTRCEGDRIQPFGSGKVQKLKTYFIKNKIPSEIRENIPLIVLNDEILYIPQIAVSEKLRVDKNDEICYKITINKEV